MAKLYKQPIFLEGFEIVKVSEGRYVPLLYKSKWKSRCAICGGPGADPDSTVSWCSKCEDLYSYNGKKDEAFLKQQFPELETLRFRRDEWGMFQFIGNLPRDNRLNVSQEQAKEILQDHVAHLHDQIKQRDEYRRQEAELRRQGSSFRALF